MANRVRRHLDPKDVRTELCLSNTPDAEKIFKIVCRVTRNEHDAVYPPFFRGIPPFTEKLLQSFLKYFLLYQF